MTEQNANPGATQRNLSETRTQISDKLADLLMPSDRGKFFIENVEVSKAKYLEQMAAAFVLNVGLPATRCELVQQELPYPQIGWRFFYRVRE